MRLKAPNLYAVSCILQGDPLKSPSPTFLLSFLQSTTGSTPCDLYFQFAFYIFHFESTGNSSHCLPTLVLNKSPTFSNFTRREGNYFFYWSLPPCFSLLCERHFWSPVAPSLKLLAGSLRLLLPKFLQHPLFRVKQRTTTKRIQNASILLISFPVHRFSVVRAEAWHGSWGIQCFCKSHLGDSITLLI